MKLADNAKKFFIWSYIIAAISLFGFSAIGLIAFSFIKGFTISASIWLGLLGVFLLAIVASYFLAIATAETYSYDVSSEGVSLQKGIFTKTKLFIPFTKIQDVILVRAFSVRLLGFTTIVIQNAGAGLPFGNGGSIASLGGMMIIPALEPTVAEQLRESILKHVNQANHTPL